MNLAIHRLYLLLGANLGDRKQTFGQARQEIISYIGAITARSGLYETAAWGVPAQPAYLNQVLVLDTYLTPAGVLTQTQAIEERLGRVRTQKWGARLIDIDLLFYDDLILHTPALTLPHPLLHERRFTLLPLAEIAPDLMHPVLKTTVGTLLAACTDSGEVTRLTD